jgi:hypothetical protein
MKFLSRKTRTVTAAHTCEHSRRAVDLVNARYEDRAKREQQAAQEKADLIDRVAGRYYIASAIVSAAFKDGVKPSSHMIGSMYGHIEALAAITGLDSITVGYRMEHGLSLTDSTEMCVVDNNGTLPVILRKDSDVRLPVAERLDRLHREALRADNHPMLFALYGESAA